MTDVVRGGCDARDQRRWGTIFRVRYGSFGAICRVVVSTITPDRKHVSRKLSGAKTDTICKYVFSDEARA